MSVLSKLSDKINKTSIQNPIGFFLEVRQADGIMIWKANEQELTRNFSRKPNIWGWRDNLLYQTL